MLHISDICDNNSPEIANPLFWFYCPFGIVVLVIRLFIIASFVFFSVVTPPEWRRVSFPVLRWLLGIRVGLNRTKRAIGQEIGRTVVAVNHVSVIDYWVTPEIGHPVVVSGTALRRENRLDPIIFKTMELVSGVRFLPARDARGIAALLERWRLKKEATTLYVPAEMTINNGRGLFRFNPTLLSRGFPVVPMALTITTCLGLVPHPLMSGGLATMLRLLMLPRVRFAVAYLPAQHRAPGEAPQHFADRIQRMIADHLGIPATAFTVEDKRLYRNAKSSGARVS
ncbi:ancient ubiquitous protein 1 [Azospirillum fermentarium]|uniref:hypothetical protein n=1 Tax=Azospirillum fermentarium TaxID=1233114 RepID=UPI00222691DC|nr:hypothetical protein [Azospirillum fermentarium]MCW2244448.1 ancient ubiquitous protein 1 [Azospirillum fermentarium]